MTHRESDADTNGATETDEPNAREPSSFEARLLRSAKLDEPSPSDQQQAAMRLFAERRVAHLPRSTSVPGSASWPARASWIFGGAGALAMAAAVAFVVFRKTPPLELVAEAPHASASVPVVLKPPALPSCPKVVVANGLSPLLDDMEDRNARIRANDGRTGIWKLFHDGTGTTSPPGNIGPGALHPSRIADGGRGTSHYALHVIGNRFKEWGVDVGTDLVAEKTCYDASAYVGVEFWAKGNNRVNLSVRMADIVDSRYGGLCEVDCYASHRTPIDLKENFEHFRVLWSDLVQLPAKTPLVFDPARLYSLNFGVDSPDTPFDMWIDDVSFIPREP